MALLATAAADSFITLSNASRIKARGEIIDLRGFSALKHSVVGGVAKVRRPFTLQHLPRSS